MSEMRFTEFPTLSVDPKVVISRSTSETDVLIYFLTYGIKLIIYHFLLYLTFYVALQHFPNAIRCFSWW